MPYIRLNELNMYYEEFGSGEPVLFLHSAYSRGILAFCGQIQPFYAAGYRGIYPDYRGHGRTLCDSLRWSSDMLCEDMIGFLDKLGIERAHLVGYSTGGGVAYYLASRYPERVKSVISIGNGGVADGTGAESCLPEALIANSSEGFIDNIKSLHAEAHRGDWEEYARQEVYDWQKHPHLTETEWRRLTAPMLLIAGEKDSYASAERLYRIQSLCPNTEVHIIKDGIHGVHFPNEQGKELNRLMLDFLKGLRSK